MEVIVGNYSGFCSGVNYTYSKAKEEILKGKTYCLGEIIHNKQVVEELESMGMITVNNIEEVPNNSRVIFRAHGESELIYDKAKEKKLEVIDLTCGRVRIVHNKVAKAKKNYFIIIIGKKTHPEIIGTIGFAGKNSSVIENEDDIIDAYNRFITSKLNKIYVVSQTTFSSKLFDSLIDKIKKQFINIEIFEDKTICDATEKRQEEVDEISKKCSVVLVIGSRNSSNTMELYNIALKNCQKVFFVTGDDSLSSIKLIEDDIVGVVAGASAPKYLIDSIVNKIKNE